MNKTTMLLIARLFSCLAAHDGLEEFLSSANAKNLLSQRLEMDEYAEEPRLELETDEYAEEPGLESAIDEYAQEMSAAAKDNAAALVSEIEGLMLSSKKNKKNKNKKDKKHKNDKKHNKGKDKKDKKHKDKKGKKNTCEKCKKLRCRKDKECNKCAKYCEEEQMGMKNIWSRGYHMHDDVQNTLEQLRMLGETETNLLFHELWNQVKGHVAKHAHRLVNKHLGANDQGDDDDDHDGDDVQTTMEQLRMLGDTETNLFLDALGEHLGGALGHLIGGQSGRQVGHQIGGLIGNIAQFRRR